jgi:hypothetical protein
LGIFAQKTRLLKNNSLYFKYLRFRFGQLAQKAASVRRILSARMAAAQAMVSG